jgi:enoyl-CoA hydratase
VTLERPPVNALNRRLREECIALFSMLAERRDVRAIILTGGGKTFCAGADLNDRPDSQVPGAYSQHNRHVRETFNALIECPKPIIAAVNGAAIGAGMALASCCDILIAAESAWISMPEVDIGLAGGVAHVLRHFSQSDARLLMFTARKIGGPELLRMRAVSACVLDSELAVAAREIALQIAEKSPLAVRAAKSSFIVAGELGLDEGYRYEQSQTVWLATQSDHAEAQNARVEKRKAQFPD